MATNTELRTIPWGGLGTDTSDAKTAHDALATAGLDWDVKLHSLYVQLGKNKKKVDDRFAVVRQQDEQVLGTVGKRYVPFQNRDAFTFADNLVESGEASYETAGGMRNGKVVFLTMKVPMDLTIAKDDVHDLYIVLRTSHDGSTAVGVTVTPIRVACLNAMTAAVKEARAKWSAPHTSTLEGKLAEARDTLRLTKAYAEEFVKLGNELVSVKVTDDMLQKLLQDTLPVRPKTHEVIDNIMNLWESSDTNGFRGTGWGAMNAITEYFDHFRDTTSAEAVMMSTLDGEIASIRNRAAQSLLSV